MFRHASIAMARRQAFAEALLRETPLVWETAGPLPDTFFAAPARRRDRPRWKGGNRCEVFWQLTGQALQKRHDIARFGVAQRHPELHPRHDPDGLRKRRHRPVVKIR